MNGQSHEHTNGIPHQPFKQDLSEFFAMQPHDDMHDPVQERPDEEITSDRLFEVVSAALRAVRELMPEGLMTPLEIHGSAMQPDYLAEFTRFEMEQADTFIHRMGLLDDLGPDDLDLMGPDGLDPMN